jgi:hypothetical protein
MTRYIRSIFALLFLSLALLSLQAGAQENTTTPDASVTVFYKWFFKNDNDRTYPLREPAIYDYVAKRTVERLRDDYSRGGPPQGVDYFLKVQDYDPQDWANHIDTHAATLLGDVAVVPVTFGSRNKISVLVFLRKQEGRWKVTKIDDTLDYN